MEREVHKMHERLIHIIAFYGTLEEFQAPDEKKDEKREPSDEVHYFNFILCVEHVVENSLKKRCLLHFQRSY
jgi:hypothetical protein